MKLSLFLLLLVSLCSCADVYEDITAHPDGSFTIKRTLTMENKLELFGSELSSAFADSSVAPASTAKPKFDSTVQKFIIPKSAFERLPGFVSYRAFDSSTDSMIKAGVEIQLKDMTSLSTIHHIFWKSNDSLKDNSKGNEFSGFMGDSSTTLPEFNLAVSKAGNKTTLAFSLPSVNMDTVKLPPMVSKKIFKALLSVLGMHIRIFSNNLLPPIESCQIENNSGFQEWEVPLDKIFDSRKRTEAHFIIENK